MTSEEIRTILNNPQDPGLEYIADPDVYEKEVLSGYKMDVVPYRFSLLDQYCPAKMGELTCIIGHTNVGKTTVILWMLSMLAKSEKKIVVYSAENRISSIVKNVYRFVFGHGNWQKAELVKLRERFKFIKHERQFSYKDMLNQATYLLDADFDFDFFFIDPYNALKIDNKNRLNTHDYHYEAIEDMRVFTMTTNKSIFLNCHTVTESQRTKADQNGHKPVPLDSDVEGGAKFPNKADNTIVIHRQIGSAIPNEKYITEIHIRKVRNQEFGGEPTPYTEPIRIRYRMDRTGFDLVGNEKISDYKNISFYEPKNESPPINSEGMPF
jgi:energy-coupling factor transporter ATP-binding protein EcfA2